MVREFARKHGPALRSLSAVGGALATAAAVAIGAVLAVFFAATVVVIAVMASADGTRAVGDKIGEKIPGTVQNEAAKKP